MAGPSGVEPLASTISTNSGKNAEKRIEATTDAVGENAARVITVIGISKPAAAPMASTWIRASWDETHWMEVPEELDFAPPAVYPLQLRDTKPPPMINSHQDWLDDIIAAARKAEEARS